MSLVSACELHDPVMSAVAELLREGLGALQEDRAAARACVARAFSLLDSDPRADAAASVRGLSPWQRRRVLQHIEANIDKSILMADLADVARLSSGYFMSAFKRCFGVTPHAYVVQRRIEHAQSIMLSTSEPLSQVALACGFSDQAHFTRRFRRAIGTSPRAWRRENQREGVDQRFDKG